MRRKLSRTSDICSSQYRTGNIRGLSDYSKKIQNKVTGVSHVTGAVAFGLHCDCFPRGLPSAGYYVPPGPVTLTATYSFCCGICSLGRAQWLQLSPGSWGFSQCWLTAPGSGGASLLSAEASSFGDSWVSSQHED